MDENKIKTSKYSLTKVRECYQSENYGRAYAHFILWLELNPDDRDKMEEFFVFITQMWCTTLESLEAERDLKFCLTQGLRYYPNNLKLLSDFGAYYNRCNEPTNAIKYFEKAHELYPESLTTEKNLQSMYACKVPQWHYRMLNDKQRNEAYKNAIEHTLNQLQSVQTIKIIDIGTGSGLLSLFANNVSKKNQTKLQILAVEECVIMSQVAHKNFLHNNIQNVNLLQCLSTSIAKHNTFTLLITEIFDCCLFGEGVLTTLIHAHNNLLKPNAIVLPYSAKLFIFGVESEEINQKYRVQHDQSLFKIPKCTKKKHEEPYDAFSINLFSYKQITTIECVGNINFNNLQELEKIYSDQNAFQTVELKTIDEGQCHAFVICFELMLDQDEMFKISTNPLEENNICLCWEQGIVFPKHEISVKRNDCISLHVDAVGDKLNVRLSETNENQHINQTSTNRKFKESCDCWEVNSEIIALLNFKQLYQVYKKIVRHFDALHISTSVIDQGMKYILELSALPVFSVMIQDYNKTKTIDMVSCTVLTTIENVCNVKKFLTLNQINESHSSINLVFNVYDLNQKFNHIIFDPVLENGLLNEAFFANINSYKKLLVEEGTFIPGKVMLCFELVECNYFENCTQVEVDDMFGVHKEMNRYSVLEMRSLSGNFPKKIISNVMKTKIYYDQDYHESSLKVEVSNDANKISGYLYWFELNYNDEIVSTLDSSYCKAAFVTNLCNNAINTSIEGGSRFVDVKIKQECGLIKIF